ncbi:UDP-3-O-[3-hydroxymyristoyl] N-acetylglucosamine deacetylase [Agrobacterium rubi]|nr:UDP-3-O-[3-hydroxymyristoyl] N-acetylglucosamine deacetylase [Agrobacterium rubi]NTF24453.1 UDP-3-O-[3-hydroxymyristoyl] N-acetylglucosamine deacetylase [Agrobacterium rubi]
MTHHKTISARIDVHGTGLHTGRTSSVTLHPAKAGSGICFRYSGSSYQRVESLKVLATERCTRIEFEDGSTLDTIEHLMAALAMTEITDILVSFDCSEAPILDGSAVEWVRAIEGAGIVDLEGSVATMHVLRSFEFSIRGSHYTAEPGPLSYDVSIDFPNTPIGYQSVSVSGSDIRDLADSRTFVLEHEIAALRASGLALGGGLHNALVIGPRGPLNESGFRHEDECVRHKTLDLIGDLRLAGSTVIGRFKAHRPGHAATSAFLRAMVSQGVLGWREADVMRAA